MNNLTVENLGKCYHISKSDKNANALLPKLSWRSVTSFLKGEAGPGGREFWALRNVSFGAEPGRVLGIIGANGAGKSTLLKVIARVTPPSEGRVHGVGRVVSLLELGAGFNPDASARENVYLNAALYGIPKADVDRNFDKIVEFAEIGEFVETELRFFSSGMYLRLAFSVAINMQPDILLADEILAVGDLAFQERCLERVAELAHDGLTVLFVSHDMEAISRVCDQVMWINAGQVVKIGEPDDVVLEYQNAAWARNEATAGEKGRHENRYAELIGARLVTAAGKEIGAAPQSEDVFVRIRFVVRKPNITIKAGVDVNYRSTLIFRSMEPEAHAIDEAGGYEAWVRIPAHFLTEIVYSVNAFLIVEHEGKESSLIIYKALSFMSYSTAEQVEGRRKLLKGALLAPRLDWKLLTPTEIQNA
ncbi:MAG: polysaccharide ABC transporter ATP-binding protein [Vicinamibacterales bacterium]